MQLIIKKVKIENFKGMLDYEIEFSDHENIITGENGIGKTTILDATMWCLFGKNFADKQQFDIKPIIDGVVKEELSTKVEMTITIDGEEIVITRIWENSATKIMFNGTTMTGTEYNKFIGDKLGTVGNDFKALTNVDFIPSLHWKELRKLITDLIGDVSDDEMLATGEYKDIEDKIRSVGVEFAARDITDSKRVANDNLKRLDGNIEEKTKDVQSLVVNDEDVQPLKDEKEDLQIMLERLNSYESYTNEIERIDGRIEIANNKLASFDEEFNNTNQREINSINNMITSAEESIKIKKEQIKGIETQREVLKADHKKKSEEEIKIEDDKCYACGQPLPEDKITAAMAKAKEQQVKDCQAIADRGKVLLNQITAINLDIDNLNAKIKEYQEDKEHTEASKPTEDAPGKKELQLQVKTLEAQKTDLTTKIAALNIDKANIDRTTYQKRIDEITQLLATSTVLSTFKDQLVKLQDERKKLLAEKEMLTIKEQQLIKYNNTKAEAMRQKAKGCFNIADFITQETTKDGSLIETFKIAVNGVPYESLNHGMTIMVALDLIDGIQKLKGKRLPILIDGLGELTRLPFMGTQIIGCKAKFQVSKKIELEKKDKE